MASSLLKQFFDLSDFTQILTERESLEIYNAQDPYRQFFNYWTAIESAIKADGRGFSLSKDELKLSGDSAFINQTNRWYLSCINIDSSYACHLSSAVKNPQIKISRIILDDY